MRGSSPRVRGKGACLGVRTSGSGIIPAGAGKSGGLDAGIGDKGDHPRGCGEKLREVAQGVHHLGSSPRVRGKDPDGGLRIGLLRIIPAGAGKRGAGRQYGGNRRDHPRGCGEKRRCVSVLLLEKGSSPRVRGKGRGCRGDVWPSGIIPAGAGKRPAPRSSSVRQGDHPRGCGEKRLRLNVRAPRDGSSPRVRGKGTAP